jgi:hypothetical protein
MTDRLRCCSIRGRGEAYEQQRFFSHPLRVPNKIPDPPTDTSARPRKLGLWPQTCAFKLPEDYCMVLRSSRYTIYPNRSLSPISLGNALAPGFALTGRGLRPGRVPRNFVGPLRGRAGGSASSNLTFPKSRAVRLRRACEQHAGSVIGQAPMHFSSAVAREALPGLQQEDPSDRDHSACLARKSHRAD